MKNYILFLSMLSTAFVVGCGDDDPTTPPDDPKPDDNVEIVINEAYSRGGDSQYQIDWVELYNKSDESIDISGFILSDKADMSAKITIPAGTTLAAGGFLMVEVDTDDGFGLSSDGDKVYLYDNEANLLHDIEFGAMELDESWSANPDGSDTFEMMTPTPGASNTEEVVTPPTPPTDSPVVINEAHSRGKDGEYPLDWVELYNKSDETVDISGYILSDKADMSEKVTLPAGTTLAAGGFLMVEVDIETGFGLSSGGDVVFLYDSEGNLLNEIEFGAMELDESWSANPDGSDTFEMMTPTPGASNIDDGDDEEEPEEPTEPSELAGTLFINEVKVSDFGADDVDWIELYNAGNEAINIAGFQLYDSNGLEDVYTISSVTIEAGGFVTFEGDTHFGFGLGKSEESVTLLDAEGGVIDTIDLTPAGELEDDEFPAYARTTDGGDTWEKTATPTKNSTNEG